MIRGVLPLMCAEDELGKVYNSLPYYGSNGGVLADDQETAEKLVAKYNELALADDTAAADRRRQSLRPTEPRRARAQPRRREDRSVHRVVPGGRGRGSDPGSDRRERPQECGEGQEVRHRGPDRQRAARASSTGSTKRTCRRSAVSRKASGSSTCCRQSSRRERTSSSTSQTKTVRSPPRCSSCTSIAPRSTTRPSSTTAHGRCSRSPSSFFEALADAARDGYRIWNWGGTWPGQVGVYRFKRKWAAREEGYSYSTQLNDRSLLELSPAEILARYPSFFVVPFSALAKAEALS